MQTFNFPAAEKGVKDIGWLKSNFYFSFSDYSNPVKSAFGTLITFNDDYVLPAYNFNYLSSPIYLKFRVAYVQRFSYTDDNLKVFVSARCTLVICIKVWKSYIS